MPQNKIITLTPFRSPQGHKVVGVVRLAQTLNLYFNLICGVWFQNFQYSIRFVAVSLQSLPYALSNHPGQKNKDTVSAKQHGWLIKSPRLIITREFMGHPVATRTMAEMGPTYSRQYIHKKQMAFFWAASRSKLHPQRNQLSTEDSVLCTQLTHLER